MALGPGTRLGAYEIISELGSGGMGQVYRARDTRLQRDVAIKVLPDAFADDAERLARFRREAQTLAALNHPNIAHVHGLEEAGNIRALVMELVEGEDLSALIARSPRGLGVEDALAVARQIAEALDAAHEQGIVHRDLKPANVKVRADGTVKVLDFGLAKMAEGGGSGTDGSGGRTSNSPTLTAHGTQMGMILGTAAYMAPEQARGKIVDRRADIWAFGVVLSEMLTGRRLFEGDDVSDVLAAVLRQDMDWAALPATTPASIRRLLRRCLERDPRKRLSAISDARLDIDDALHAPGGLDVVPAATVAPVPPAAPTLFSRLWPALGGIVVASLVAFLMWPKAAPAASSPGALARLSILPPPGDSIFPDSTGVAISPDATMVAFVVGSVSRAQSELWVRSLETMQARRLDGIDVANLIFWSPDSRNIAFFSNDKLQTVSVNGGRPTVVCDAPAGRGAVWTATNEILLAPDASGPLFRVPAGGGTPTPLTELASQEYGHRVPRVLPDGEHFLYAVLPGKDGKFEIVAGSLKDKSRVSIGFMDAMPVYADPGWLLYARQGVLVAVPFDVHALKVTGNAITLPDEPTSILDPAMSFTAAPSISVSLTGSLAYYSSPSMNTIATWYDVSGAPKGTLKVPPGHYESAAISPDGTRAVLVRSTSPSESSLWLVDLARGGATPLSSGHGRNDSPVWSPDGTRILFSADRTGSQNIYLKNVNDSAPEQPLFVSDALFKNPSGWSPDASTFVLTQLDRGTNQNVYLVDASGTKPAALFYRTQGRDNGGPISPNGKWLAYASDESGEFELYVQTFPTPSRKVRVSEHGAVLAWWTRNSGELVFLGNDLRTLWRATVQPGATFGTNAPVQIGTLPPDLVFVDAMPDRQRFLAISPERTSTGSITVVQNWQQGLKKTP